MNLSRTLPSAVFWSFLAQGALAQQQSEATQRLLERNEMFEPAIIQVAENVYTAIGYQVSANTMIVGEDGVIIVDPGQQVPGQGRPVRQRVSIRATRRLWSASGLSGALAIVCRASAAANGRQRLAVIKNPLTVIMRAR